MAAEYEKLRAILPAARKQFAGPQWQSAWEDSAMGLRAFRRENGEYLIFTENSGWGGKNNFFRWKPE